MYVWAKDAYIVCVCVCVRVQVRFKKYDANKSHFFFLLKVEWIKIHFSQIIFDAFTQYNVIQYFRRYL